jgi:hypothetical protein
MNALNALRSEDEETSSVYHALREDNLMVASTNC